MKKATCMHCRRVVCPDGRESFTGTSGTIDTHAYLPWDALLAAMRHTTQRGHTLLNDANDMTTTGNAFIGGSVYVTITNTATSGTINQHCDR